jgi:Co/Zn/Cd efflux system component
VAHDQLDADPTVGADAGTEFRMDRGADEPRRECHDAGGRGGRRLDSPALIADGNHARSDGYVSLGVVASAMLVAFGFDRADPLIGLVITLVILKITWDSWRVITTTAPAEPID